MQIKKYLLITLIFISGTAFGFEKVGTTSFQFLKVYPTARAMALGGAYCTIANTSDAVFWNPAGLTRVGNFSAFAGYVDWFMDAAHYSFSAAYTVDSWGTFAVFGVFTDVGASEVTRVSDLGFIGNNYNPGLTGETINPSSSVLGVSFARDLNDRFTFGINVKYVREDLIYKDADAIIFDGGLIYKTGFKSIVIGASLRHFGPEVKFIDKSYPLPQTFNIGLSTTLIGGDDPLIASVSGHKVLLSYDLIQPRDYDQQHAVGLEYDFGGMVYLRGGYIFNHDQESFNAGVGINFKGYKVDYAYSDYGEYLDSVHRISVGFSIN